MKIKSNAAPQEENSPFYKQNKELCEAFEHFTAQKNGWVKGRFSAWSYSIFGRIQTNHLWNLHYKRAVYGSTGSLISVFYHKEVLSTIAIWPCEVNNDNHSFIIRRKRNLDILHSKFSLLPRHANYVIRSKGKPTKFASQILKTLQPLFNSKEIYKVQLTQKKLNIELRSDELHLDILNKLLSA